MQLAYGVAADKIERMILAGASFERLELTIRNAVGINDDQRSALWLYAFFTSSPRLREYAAPFKP